MAQMNSACDWDILGGYLHMPYVHVFLTAPLGNVHMAQPHTDQHQGRILSEEDRCTSAILSLPVKSFNDVAGTDTGPVLAARSQQISVSSMLFSTFLAASSSFI